MYIIMVGWQPITSAMGNTKESWFTVAIAMSVMYLLFLCFPLFGVKEKRLSKDDNEETTLKDMWNAIVKNDQLMWTALAMALFMVGYCITTGFATYYMQYVYGDINMYPVLAGVCGIAQLVALMVFPLFSKKYNRKQLYTFSTILIVAGYLLFSFAESSLILIGVAAVLIFVAEAFIQLLMLMFLADTIEYGQWKMGRRHESVTFSIQPLINKIGGALSTAVISVSVILAGIKTADSNVAAETISSSGVVTIKVAMLLIPVICIVLGFWIYLKKFRINEEFYSQIISDLKERGDIED
jgi:melibiose permease/lactose/raffinose/galactose permease